jgi:hypothetical protein
MPVVKIQNGGCIQDGVENAYTRNIYKNDYTTDDYNVFPRAKLNYFYDCVLGFFPARQVSGIIINESLKNTEHTLIELDHKIFYENQSIRGFTQRQK